MTREKREKREKKGTKKGDRFIFTRGTGSGLFFCHGHGVSHWLLSGLIINLRDQSYMSIDDIPGCDQ